VEGIYLTGWMFMYTKEGGNESISQEISHGG